MVTQRAPRSRSQATSAALQGCLALLLLLLPVLDLHAETTLEPIAAGTPIATAALHPGAATHFEASGTKLAQRCPACDFSQQSAGAVSPAWLPTPVLRKPLRSAPLPSSRPSTPFAPALLRGPPTR